MRFSETSHKNPLYASMFLTCITSSTQYIMTHTHRMAVASIVILQVFQSR